MARNSKVILAQGIKLDKSYKSVLCYTEQQMLSLIQSNAVTSLLDCSYIRDNNSIEVGVSLATALNSNYLAFQNPDYSNKWFFAFIDKIEYVSNGVVRILFTVDIWSTWYDYWGARNCFVVRQHQNTDVAGDNTVPEGLEHGEYTINSTYDSDKFKSCFIGVIASISGSWDGSTFTPSGDAFTRIGYNGILNGALYVCNSPKDAFDLINAILSITSPKQGEILDVYMIPKTLFPSISPTTTDIFNIATAGYTVYTGNDTIFVTKPTVLDNVTPVNKKLLTYPYNFILASNKIGNTNTWKFEDFSTTDVKVDYFGVPTVGCSILASPRSYKGVLTNYTEGLPAGKYPTLGWREDSYTNWLTQNSVNNTVRQVTMGGTAIVGATLLALSPFTGGSTAVLGGGMLASAGISAVETAGEYYQHSIEPDSIKGLISVGDVLSCVGDMGFIYYNMCIKAEYVNRLDSFFTRYGYKQNKVMMPLFDNLSYRQNYNFIQIARDEVVGVPKIITVNQQKITINSADFEVINNIFRSGVTIWKNHANKDDYSVTNNIVTPTP